MVAIQFEKPLVSVFYSKFFPIWVNVKSDPWGEVIFWPQGYNVNILGKGPLDKTKYQISKALAF